MKRLLRNLFYVLKPMSAASALEFLRGKFPGEHICVAASHWQNVHSGKAECRIEYSVTMFRGSVLKTQKISLDLDKAVQAALADYNL